MSVAPRPGCARTLATASAILCLRLVVPVAAQEPPAAPPGFSALAARADAARDAGQLDEAAALYQQALALRPRWVEGWWSLGTIRYDQDAHADAARAFRRLLTQDPDNGTAHLMLGLCEYRLGRYDRALTSVRKAKALGVRDDEQLVRVLHYHEGMLLLRLGQYERALEALHTLVKAGVEGDELDTALGLGVLLMRPQDALPAGAEQAQIVRRAGRAERLSMARSIEAARAHYGDLVREFPRFPNVHYAYGRFLLAVGDTGPGIAEFRQEIEHQPAHVRARTQIAAASYRVDSPAGLPLAQEVVKLQPDYPFGHYLLGLLYLDLRDAARAIEQLEIAARMVPREPQFQFALGNAYARAGRKADAAKARVAFLRLGGADPSPDGTSQPPALDRSVDTGPKE